MIKCASKPPSRKNDRIRNTLIILLIEQRARMNGSPLKIIENDVARFLGPIGQPQSPLGYMRVKLWPDQRARIFMVAAASHRLAMVPSNARSAQWLMTHIIARVVGGWAGKIPQTLAIKKAAAAARIKSDFCSQFFRGDFGTIVAVGIETNNRMLVADCLTVNPACVDAKCQWMSVSSGWHRWKAYQIGDTPLKIAINYGNFEIFDLLLQCDADVNIKDDKGNTALIEASTRGKLEFCDLLLRSDADVNAKCNKGETSLIKSAGLGNVDIVKLLIASKADVAARDRSGKTAFTHALENNRKKGERGLAIRDGYAEVVTYLKSTKAHKAPR